MNAQFTKYFIFKIHLNTFKFLHFDSNHIAGIALIAPK